MKRIITLMGVLGVFCLVAGCSDDGSSSPLQPVANDDPEAASSSSAVANNNSSGAQQDKIDTVTTTDTTVIHQQVIMTDSGATRYESYVSSGVFCWTPGCEAKYASSSSAAPASSETITITVSSSSAAPPPTVNGNTLTDNRNGKSYKLQNIAGKLWMAENLRYETSNSYCSTEGGEDHCAKYGQFYTYSAAKRACPDGWRLPTASEVTAADSEVAQEWWSIGGRFKVSNGSVTEYGLENEQGYIWIEAEGENNSFRIKNYSENDVHELQHSDAEERAYNVRCVQG